MCTYPRPCRHCYHAFLRRDMQFYLRCGGLGTALSFAQVRVRNVTRYRLYYSMVAAQRFAALIAAAAHDFRHPGVNNLYARPRCGLPYRRRCCS